VAVIAGPVQGSTPTIATVLVVILLIAAVYVIARMYVNRRFNRRS
jgi:hypothetical protein